MIFDADYPRRGFSAYSVFAPSTVVVGEDVAIVDDPLGGGRRVARFDNAAGKHVGTLWARASAASPELVQPGGVYRATFEVCTPWDTALVEPDAWEGLGTGAWGAPWVGEGGMSFRLYRYPDGLIGVQFGSSQRRILERVPWTYNAWHTVTQTFRFDYEGWVELTLDGRTILPRTGYDTRRRGSNDERGNATRVGVYSSQHVVNYYATHRLEQLTA